MRRQEKRNIGTFSKISSLGLAILAMTLGSPFLSANDNLQPPSNTTTVYKTVNPDGSISFSDQAQSNAERLEVPPVATVPAFKPENKISVQAPKSGGAYYQSITILNPQNGSAFHSGSGTVEVSTKIEPALRSGDLVRFSFNGTEVKTLAGTGIQISDVNRGTHVITVEIIDQNSNTLMSSSSQFTVHRPIARPFSTR